MAATLPSRSKRLASGIFCLRAKFLLDPQELIVFGGTIGPRQRSSCYRSAACCDREVGDGGVFGVPGAMRDDGGVARLTRHFDGGKSLAQRANLIDLDQDRVGDAFFDALSQPRDLGN
jgi:hypothetical protein